MKDKMFQFYLAQLPETGSVSRNMLLAEYGSAYGVYEAIKRNSGSLKQILDEDRIREIRSFTDSYDPEGAYREFLKTDIRFLTEEDRDYPEKLRRINRPPYGLFVKGALPENDCPAIAVIGARNCSEYGRYIAGEFGRYIASQGINVISGMAIGIDGIAQWGAIRGGGKTFAVLGSGVDVCYPRSNRDLYDRIREKGGILSCFPPGANPMKRFFPERNRIVAALADIVLVIEARNRSGTSNTVEHAISFGREVYAVPGRITDRLSDGCNLLLRQGAGVALSPEDLVMETRILYGRQNPDKVQPQNRVTPGAGKKELIDHVDLHPRSCEEIFERYRKSRKGAELSDVMKELVLLAAEGRIVQVGSGYFYRQAGGDAQETIF